ncbi:hypothetical protein ACXYN8_03055 [Altererythrobacter sp. CAU 1778]
MSLCPRLLLPIFIAAVALNGCSRAQQAFEAVQMCVDDQDGVADLKNIMSAVAQSEGLQFIDNSAQQGAELKSVGADKALGRDAAYAIDLYIEGENGLGATAGNLGLPPYQVGVGFTEGDDPIKARKLANNLIRALSKRWDLQRVAKNKGILSSHSCGA